MGAQKTEEKNPVARLREKFFEKKKRVTPSTEIKDTFKKESEPTQGKEEVKRKIAASRPPEAGA